MTSARGSYARARQVLWPRRHALGYALAPLFGRSYHKPPAYLGHKRALAKEIAQHVNANLHQAAEYEAALRRIRMWSTTPCGPEVLGRLAAEALEKGGGTVD